MSYDPALHHPPSPRFRRTSRRSIRLKGHDYAGGGVYFVTLCAHREFMAWAGGNPFGMSAAVNAGHIPPLGATCVSPVRIIAGEWRRCGEIRDDVFPGEFVVMPDHFHGLIRIEKGQSELGHVIGAFKAEALGSRLYFHTNEIDIGGGMEFNYAHSDAAHFRSCDEVSNVWKHRRDNHTQWPLIHS